jgi:hypothetical protein
METSQGNMEADRVRAATTPKSLQKIDQTIEEKVRFYASQPREVITRRISELDREWDIERMIETNASSLALLGVVLGLTRGRQWLLLSAGVLGFLLWHGTKGWCPPVPALRKMGVRTRGEIDREKFALKVLRGDFQEISPIPEEMKTAPIAQALDAVKS